MKKVSKKPSSKKASPKETPPTSETAEKEEALSVVTTPPVENSETPSFSPIPETTPDTPKPPETTNQPFLQTVSVEPKVEEEKEKPKEELKVSTPQSDFKIFEPEEKKKNGSILKLIGLFLLGVILGGGGVFAFFFFNPLKFIKNPISLPKKVAVKTTTTPAPTLETKKQEATSSAQKEIPVADYKIQVLNGSGVSGAAAKVKDTLQKEGFANFALGNTALTNTASTEVKMKESVKSEVYSLIEKALSDYPTTLVKDKIASSSSFDIIITVGKKK